MFKDLIAIPSMKSLNTKYKDYNPVFKVFIPFAYIQTPLAQLFVVSSGAYFIYKAFVHWSSGALASPLLEVMFISLYLTSMGVFVTKYIKLGDKQNRYVELLGIFLMFVFICVLIIDFNMSITFLLFVPFSLIKYFLKHHTSVNLSPRDRFKNTVVQTVYAQSDRINVLYANKMFVSGFYSKFVLRQYLVVIVYYFVNIDVPESGLLLHYAIVHICFNMHNRMIGVLFGNPRGTSFSKLVEGSVAAATLFGTAVMARVGYIDDYNKVTTEGGEVNSSILGDHMTRFHQNQAGFNFNYNDQIGRDMATAARSSSPEFVENYLLNAKGELCSQCPIGSEGRIIDPIKTGECLTQNNITIQKSELGVKRFAKVLDETTTFGRLMSKDGFK